MTITDRFVLSLVVSELFIILTWIRIGYGTKSRGTKTI